MEDNPKPWQTGRCQDLLLDVGIFYNPFWDQEGLRTDPEHFGFAYFYNMSQYQNLWIQFSANSTMFIYVACANGWAKNPWLRMADSVETQ